jgi:hypothetical protein
MISLPLFAILTIGGEGETHVTFFHPLEPSGFYERSMIRKFAGTAWVTGSESGSILDLAKVAPKPGAAVKFVGPNLFAVVVTPELGERDSIGDVSWTANGHKILVRVQIQHSTSERHRPGCRSLEYGFVVNSGTYNMSVIFKGLAQNEPNQRPSSRPVSIRYQGE